MSILDNFGPRAAMITVIAGLGTVAYLAIVKPALNSGNHVTRAFSEKDAPRGDSGVGDFYFGLPRLQQQAHTPSKPPEPDYKFEEIPNPPQSKTQLGKYVEQDLTKK